MASRSVQVAVAAAVVVVPFGCAASGGGPRCLRRNVGRRPRFLPPRGFRYLAAARRGLRDPLLHSATAPPPLPGYRASRARPPQPLPALSRSRHSNRLDGVRRSLAQRTREDRLHAGDDDLAKLSPDDRCDPRPAAGPGPATGKDQAVRSSAARSARRRPRSPRPGWSPLSTGPVLRASIRCCHKTRGAYQPRRGPARGNCFN